jgi:hypothetical protein
MGYSRFSIAPALAGIAPLENGIPPVVRGPLGCRDAPTLAMRIAIVL